MNKPDNQNEENEPSQNQERISDCGDSSYSTNLYEAVAVSDLMVGDVIFTQSKGDTEIEQIDGGKNDELVQGYCRYGRRLFSTMPHHKEMRVYSG